MAGVDAKYSVFITISGRYTRINSTTTWYSVTKIHDEEPPNLHLAPPPKVRKAPACYLYYCSSRAPPQWSRDLLPTKERTPRPNRDPFRCQRRGTVAISRGLRGSNGRRRLSNVLRSFPTGFQQNGSTDYAGTAQKEVQGTPYRDPTTSNFFARGGLRGSKRPPEAHPQNWQNALGGWGGAYLPGTFPEKEYSLLGLRTPPPRPTQTRHTY